MLSGVVAILHVNFQVMLGLTMFTDQRLLRVQIILTLILVVSFVASAFEVDFFLFFQVLQFRPLQASLLR